MADAGVGSDGAADSTPFARAGRWLTTIPVTLAVCGLLSLVFALELLVLATAGSGAFRYWFVASATPDPGWVLAAFAHSPVRTLHLPGNLALVLVFGGMVERRLSRWQYVGFLAVAGVGGTLAQVVSYAIAVPGSGGTLGASAMAMAAATFAVVTSGRTKLRTGRWSGEATWVWTLVGGVIVGRRLLLDYVVAVPAVGRYGHLWGILFGVAVALTARPGDGESSAVE